MHSGTCSRPARLAVSVTFLELVQLLQPLKSGLREKTVTYRPDWQKDSGVAGTGLSFFTRTCTSGQSWVVPAVGDGSLPRLSVCLGGGRSSAHPSLSGHVLLSRTPPTGHLVRGTAPFYFSDYVGKSDVPGCRGYGGWKQNRPNSWPFSLLN